MSTFVVLEAYTTLRREIGLMAAAELKSAEFGHKQMMILYRVAVSPASMNELADHAQSDPAAITRAVSSMEGLGFVRRRPDPNDSRKAIVELTSKGKTKATRALEIRNRIGKSLNRTLTIQEQKTLTTLLNKVASGLQEQREQKAKER